MSLKVAPNLELPLDAVTQTFGILAMRGAGKTNLARVMAEEMFAQRLPFVAIDPVGSWWGLRSSRDGKQSGLEIPIFGGRKSDVPLEQTGGQLVADLVARDRMSCILDVSEFGEGEKRRFLLDFGDRLYRKNEDALHLFLEEADDYIPQGKSFAGNAGQLLGVWQNIVRRGRARGLGMTMITQRSACINKDVLTQVGTLFAMRVTAPQDREAIRGWVEYHGQAKEILQSLPALESGEFWCYSPEWLRICSRHRARLSRTFDSGATPKGATHGKRPVATLADIDLTKIASAMSDTIERAKQDDPRELKKQVAELKRQLAAAEKQGRVERVEVPVLDAKQQKLLADAAAAATKWIERLGLISATNSQLVQAPAPALDVPRQTPGLVSKPVGRPQVLRFAEPTVKGASPQGGDATFTKAQRLILTSLAQAGKPRTAVQIAVLTGYSAGGGAFRRALGELRTRQLISGDSPRIEITELGLSELGPFDPLPTGRALQEYWQRQLPLAQRSILIVVCKHYPRAVSVHDVAIATNYEANGGAFRRAMGRLRTLELIHGRGELTASAELFE